MKRILLTFLVLLAGAMSLQAQELVIREAKYKTGDNLQWKNPAFDDSGWTTLDVNREWTYQGIDNENGYGWYRITVTLPSSMKKADPLKKAFVIDLGFTGPVRDLWRQKSITPSEVLIASHGVKLVKVR